MADHLGVWVARLLDDRAQVPATRVTNHSGRVELAVPAADLAGRQVEAPELVLLAGRALGLDGFRGFQNDERVFAQLLLGFFESDERRHGTPFGSCLIIRLKRIRSVYR